MTGTACLSSRWPQARAPQSRSAAHRRTTSLSKTSAPPIYRRTCEPCASFQSSHRHSSMRQSTSCGWASMWRIGGNQEPCLCCSCARRHPRWGPTAPSMSPSSCERLQSEDTRACPPAVAPARTRIVRSWRRTDTAPGPFCDAADVAKREALATVVQPFAQWFLAQSWRPPQASRLKSPVVCLNAAGAGLH